MNSHVIKVGGENASDPRTAEWIARYHAQWNQIAVAISALRTKPLNTTSELMKAQEAFVSWGMEGARPILEELFRVHSQTLREAWMLDGELEGKLRFLFETYFPWDLSFPADLLKQHPWFAKEQRFVGYGEVMSAHVLAHLLEHRHKVANVLISDPIQGKRNDIDDSLRLALSERVGNILEAWGVAIVPGYQTVFGQSILEAYGRGYTDKIAERIAVGLRDRWHTPTLHIQKQVPLLSSNPKNIAGAVPLSRISYWTGAEITGARGANAQVLNEHTISADIAWKWIPIWVYNPFESSWSKSIIDATGNSEWGIEFVDGRDHVATITVSGFSMSWPGLLSTLTDIFAWANISIDSISSSETEVTFTIYGELTPLDQTELQEKIQMKLPASQYSVEVKNNLWLIYCIGDNLSGHPGVLENISSVLANGGIDIECVYQARGQRAVTIWVASEKLKRWVELLHEALIEKKQKS